MNKDISQHTKPQKTDIAKREEEILHFWDTNAIFKKTEEKDAPQGEFVFYDGPPFATGLPHYGHILAGTIKDVIPRYKTMQGYRVRRQWGWDCHGLPLENEIEKELNLKTKKDIEALGVKTFNETARKAVLRYADDWKRIVPRLGRWVHMDQDYKTMDTSYTESVWWAFKTLYNRNLVYEGFKTMHLCPRCGTTLSNFEVNQGYKDTTDISVYVKFLLANEPNTYLLAWTTTPWTLPGNMALAVNPSLMYVKARVGDEVFILAKDQLSILGEDVIIIEEVAGNALVGLSYTPLFSYYRDEQLSHKENAWKIYAADFVTAQDGTGIVHIAPAFGDDDLALAQQYLIPVVHHVTKEGVFAPEVADFTGQTAKPKEDPQAGDVAVIKYLAHQGSLFKKEKITHSYPFCWRCDTPLLNYASSSWFVRVTDFKDKLVAENKKIRWVPQEIGTSRFGNWLSNARDWAISRSRYWGAPLPVWKNEATKEVVAIGSIEELKKHIKTSRNTYFIMRHGESESNVQTIVSTKADNPHHLTKKGEAEVVRAAQKLPQIDMIITSPFVRTRETAECVATTIGLSKEQIVVDARLSEINLAGLNNKHITEYWALLPTYDERYEKGPEGGESIRDVRRRVGALLYDIEKAHEGKTILFITHEYPTWMLEAVAQGLSKEKTIDIKSKKNDFITTGEVRKLPFIPLPHNDDFVLDLHRPYIDNVCLIDEKGNELVRVPDVFDCWFESGSMPYAKEHYPFEHTDIFNPQKGLFRSSKGYPADFIAEGVDQTRGWFYSLLVLGVALFKHSPYKNVIVNGLVLGEDGKKMSKRLKNYPDPFVVVDQYGADSLRYFLLASPIVKGEDLSFSEKGVDEVMKKVIGRLSNVLSFYQLYANETNVYETQKSTTTLDRWITARLHTLINEVTIAMEAYELDRATRPIAEFIDDLSTWYIRRSRDRFKGEDKEDGLCALHTTQYVLQELSKIMAPFMPFYAEILFRAVRNKDDEESVHLCSWPKKEKSDEKLLVHMEHVRAIVSRGLEARAGAGIKVRQPLQSLTVEGSSIKDNEEYVSLIKDEVNVKEVFFTGEDSSVVLDTHISETLKKEGMVRDLIRQIQQLRKDTGLSPQDTATLSVDTSDELQKVISEFEEDIKKTALLSNISFSTVSDGEQFSIDGHDITLLFE